MDGGGGPSEQRPRVPSKREKWQVDETPPKRAKTGDFGLGSAEAARDLQGQPSPQALVAERQEFDEARSELMQAKEARDETATTSVMDAGATQYLEEFARLSLLSRSNSAGMEQLKLRIARFQADLAGQKAHIAKLETEQASMETHRAMNLNDATSMVEAPMVSIGSNSGPLLSDCVPSVSC